jgi:hypothetical protein
MDARRCARGVTGVLAASSAAMAVQASPLLAAAGGTEHTVTMTDPTTPVVSFQKANMTCF